MSPLSKDYTLTNSITHAPLTIAERDRSLAAIVALTTHCAYGGAARLKAGGYLRRDWLLFVSAACAGSLPSDATKIAQDLSCDLIAVQPSSSAKAPTLRAGTRLWGRVFWHEGLQLWRDDLRGRCCLVDTRQFDQHIWLETGRIVASEGVPWRDAEDRVLGFARADAAYCRMALER